MSGEAACPGCARLRRALAGGDADLVAALPHSLLLLGEHQAYPGYAVLWSRTCARELHQLDEAACAGFCADLRRASAAVQAATGCRKLNLAALGNAVPHLHVHLFPRQAGDPEGLRHPWVREAGFGEPGSPAEREAWAARLRRALEAA